MAINFTQPQNRNKSYIRQVTSWVEDELPDSLEDAMVMVNELQCFEPGCAPLETVISILGPKSHVFKIFKPVKEVMPEEVITAVQNALNGTASQQQHIVQQIPPG